MSLHQQFKEIRYYVFPNQQVKVSSKPTCLTSSSTLFTKSSSNVPDSSAAEHNFVAEISISENDVYNVLDNLDPTKATGHDRIGPRILRNCADYINLFITYLPRVYNIVTYPQNGQLILLFLYSNGERNLIINYRPISLLSNISKLLERLIYDKIIAFVSDNMSPLQFGPLKGRSSLQQLLILLNYIISSNKQTDD